LIRFRHAAITPLLPMPPLLIFTLSPFRFRHYAAIFTPLSFSFRHISILMMPLIFDVLPAMIKKAWRLRFVYVQRCAPRIAVLRRASARCAMKERLLLFAGASAATPSPF
jgi:hypothetical protein